LLSAELVYKLAFVILSPFCPKTGVTDAAVLPVGYAATARKTADRRMMLASYNLASLLAFLTGH